MTASLCHEGASYTSRSLRGQWGVRGDDCATAPTSTQSHAVSPADVFHQSCGSQTYVLTQVADGTALLWGTCRITATQAGLPALGQQRLPVALTPCSTHHYHPAPDTEPGYCGDTTPSPCSSFVNKTDGSREEERWGAEEDRTGGHTDNRRVYHRWWAQPRGGNVRIWVWMWEKWAVWK